MALNFLGKIGDVEKYDSCEHDFAFAEIPYSDDCGQREFWKCKKCGAGVIDENIESNTSYVEPYIDPNAKETEAKLGSCERYCWDWKCPHCSKDNKSAPDKTSSYCNYCNKLVYLKPTGQAMFDNSGEPWT